MAETIEKDSLVLAEGSSGSKTKPSKRFSANTSTSSPANASWLVGDVVWSKIPGHPWWPSMVAYDPNSAVYFRYKGRARYYHVQFFGQDPVRGWASERSVMKFEGKDHFEASMHNKKHQVASKRIALWETAVKVAEKALPMNRQERQLCFTFKYFDKNEKKGKRKAINGVRTEGQYFAPKPDHIHPEVLPNLNGHSESTEREGDKTTKLKGQKKRKQKSIEDTNDVVKTDQVTVKEDLETAVVKISPKRKRIRKPKVHEDEIVDKFVVKLHGIEEPPQTPPRLNGSFPGSPVNGEVSPNTALKLKIRKVRPSLDGKEGNKNHHRLSKEKETFIIVKDLEHSEDSTDSGVNGVCQLQSPVDAKQTSSSSADEGPRKKKRRRKLSEGVMPQDYSIQEDKRKFKKNNKEGKGTIQSKSAKESKVTTKKSKAGKESSVNKKVKAVPKAKVANKSSEKTKKVKPVEKPHDQVSSSADILAVSESKKPINGFPDVTRSLVSSMDDDTSSTKSSTISKVRKDKGDKESEAVCAVCEQVNDLMFCGDCNSAYHPDCIGLSTAPKGKFKCDECTSGVHSCFVCRQTGDVKACSQPLCSKFYHKECLQSYKCSKIDGDRIYCPLHFCSTCISNKTPVNRGRLTKCIRCPTAYHAGCLVAGCMPITSHLMVCAKHFLPNKSKAHHTHVNVNWCFVCSIGGTLICCESCPAAFHPECISYEGIPEGRFYCKDCVEGKSLLYGDIVWVKLGMYRWWPAMICNPRDVPTNIQSMRHQPGEFPVMFLGSHDFYWIHKGRVFSYQDGDKGTESGNNKYLAKVFKKALVEAKEKYDEWKKAREDKAEQDLQRFCKKPPQYKHIKTNKCTTAQRIILDPSEMPVCECTPDQACGQDANCLNLMLQFECVASRCPAGDKCQNQRFQKRQYVDCEPFRAHSRGWGLRSKQAIKKGTFVIEYVGELIDDATCRERVKKGDDDTNYYMLTIDKDCIIDAGPMGNLSRFMNHSCYPNCETQKWTVNGEVRVGLFTSRDVESQEELTFDYCLDCHGNEKKKCHCGSQNCSGFLGVRPKTQNAQMNEDKAKNAALKRRKRKPKKPAVKQDPPDTSRRADSAYNVNPTELLNSATEPKHVEQPALVKLTSCSDVESSEMGLDYNAASPPIKLTGSSPLNSVLPWTTYDPLEELAKIT
ncbi:histone-lysine N-methyltransferase NSD2 isoform X2 [Nematostella vectensis]|uniref:histone-lysine N-methyltransferase NSD2 isoform X2 n=1 Tax=Nematostella vectensis TaxID=45351 RepID=UPI0013905C34|nr:histone-lysine N-methyltransferase NSD2 isoform X2 [Nematostella vectensis]